MLNKYNNNIYFNINKYNNNIKNIINKVGTANLVVLCHSSFVLKYHTTTAYNCIKFVNSEKYHVDCTQFSLSN